MFYSVTGILGGNRFHLAKRASKTFNSVDFVNSAIHKIVHKIQLIVLNSKQVGQISVPLRC